MFFADTFKIISWIYLFYSFIITFIWVYKKSSETDLKKVRKTICASADDSRLAS